MSEKEFRYTVYLRDAFRAPVTKRAEVAIRKLKTEVARLTKAEEVVVSEDVNKKIWSRGARKPPSRLTVEVSVKDGVAYIGLEKEDERKQ
jgi:large subunit ribosomal protein L31e